MNLSSIVLDVAGYLKPVLLKLFPHSLLRKLKRNMIKSSYIKLKEVQISPFCRNTIA